MDLEDGGGFLNKAHIQTLPDLVEAIHRQQERKWNTLVYRAIKNFWMDKIQADTMDKSSLKYLCTDMKRNRPHSVLCSIDTNTREVCKPAVKSRFLTDTCILQSNRARFNKTKQITCLMCKKGDEDVPHFLLHCGILTAHSGDLLHKTKQLIYSQILVPPAALSEHDLCQLIIDHTHSSVVDQIRLTSEAARVLEMLS